MYIQNATYKTIPTEGLTFPLEAGTVLTVNNITGIVPEKVAVAAPTGVLYLAVGGTIDLTSEANAGITFTDAELNALGGDFNFIPLAEAGGSSLPSYTSADKGKVLTIGEGEGSVEPKWEAAEGGGIPFVGQTLPISVKWGNSTKQIDGVILFVFDVNEILTTNYYAIVLPDDEYAKLTGHYGFAGFSPDGSTYTVAPVTDCVTPRTVDAPSDTSSLEGRNWVQPITSLDIKYLVEYYDTNNQTWKDLVLVKASEVEYDILDV